MQDTELLAKICQVDLPVKQEKISNNMGGEKI